MWRMLEKQIREFHPKTWLQSGEEEAAQRSGRRVQDLDVKSSADGWSYRTCQNAGERHSGDCYRGNDRNQTNHGSNPCR